MGDLIIRLRIINQAIPSVNDIHNQSAIKN